MIATHLVQGKLQRTAIVCLFMEQLNESFCIAVVLLNLTFNNYIKKHSLKRLYYVLLLIVSKYMYNELNHIL